MTRPRISNGGRMRFPKIADGASGPDAHQKPAAATDGAAHVTAQHEAQAAEQSFLVHVGSRRTAIPDALGGLSS